MGIHPISWEKIIDEIFSKNIFWDKTSNEY
jgi:hypothetical protein